MPVPSPTDGLLTLLTTPDGEIDAGADPAALELLGTLVADTLRAHAVGVVVSWNDPDDAVLAHVVARELGVPSRRASLDLGRLELDGPPLAGAVVAVVATSFTPRPRALEPLARLLAGAGASAVHAARLRPSPSTELDVHGRGADA
ncbi:hypothetical protein GCM10025875_04870 [Litorihabitans aurantiacus]|uniref:Uncharacterized protein n=1 Tax=Litorihabitans aurantiacus TaxID=1930061 RepID=A0AA37XCZ8_9MICO|nr:hypothetical protein GCM10025875_04870 [Litorihabitans aurantiacus]